MEIGCWEGDFSESLVESFPESKLVLVDPWKSSEKNSTGWYGSENVNDEKMNQIYHSVCNKFKDNKNVTVHRGTVISFYESNLQSTMDIVYVDGDHSYEGVLLDLVYADKFTNINSIIALDDYSRNAWWKDDVIKALNSFLGMNASKYQFLTRQGNQVYIQKINN